MKVKGAVPPDVISDTPPLSAPHVELIGNRLTEGPVVFSTVAVINVSQELPSVTVIS
jgi:hypothetical protein